MHTLASKLQPISRLRGSSSINASLGHYQAFEIFDHTGIFPPVISTQQAHSGSFAAQLGATGSPVPNGDSSLYQAVTIPSNGDTLALSFWYWPSTSGAVENQWLEAQVRDSNGNKLAQIFKLASNTQTWTQVTYDLTPYTGRTIQVYFNSHEDGYSGLTYMYLDDVLITTGDGGGPQADREEQGAQDPGCSERHRSGACTPEV